MYVNWMSVYIILSCYSMWKYLVHSVFGSEILYGRLCVGWIVVLITFKPSNNIIISLLIKKKKKILSYLKLNYRQKKKWFQNRLLAGCSDHFEQKKKSFYVDSFPSFLPGTLAQALCIYSFMETSVCLPWNFGHFHNFGADCELAQTSHTYSAM